MIPLNAILAASEPTSSLATTIFVVIGILVALAFTMGFVKGFRKVSWDGLVWLAASAMFIGIGSLAPIPVGTGGFVISLIVSIFCVFITLAVFGVLSYFLRPKMRWIKDDINGDTSLAEYGLEFEPEYLDYDGEHDYAPYGKRIYKTGYGIPSFFARFIGGLTCGINIGIVLWALLSAFLLIVDTTALKEMVEFGSIFNNEVMGWLLIDARNSLFDVLTIGIMLLMAKQGYKKGLLNSLRSLVMTVGGFASVGVSFYLPFSVYEPNGFMDTLVTRCVNVFSSLGMFSDILGKLLAGVCLLALFTIGLVLLNVLLKKVCLMIESLGITRGLDSCLAAVLYTLIGAALCVGIWFVLAALDVLGIFPVSTMFSEFAYLSSNLFNFAKSILEPLFAGA